MRDFACRNFLSTTTTGIHFPWRLANRLVSLFILCTICLVTTIGTICLAKEWKLIFLNFYLLLTKRSITRELLSHIARGLRRSIPLLALSVYVSLSLILFFLLWKRPSNVFSDLFFGLSECWFLLQSQVDSWHSNCVRLYGRKKKEIPNPWFLYQTTASSSSSSSSLLFCWISIQ